MCIYLQKMPVNAISAKQNFKILVFQLTIAVIFIYFVCQGVYWITVTISFGRIALIFITVAFAFIVD